MGTRSEEIKRTLRPMLDFAPAIMRAADIVAEAEQAEALLEGLTAKKAAGQREIDDLAKSALTNKELTAQTARDLAAAQTDLAAQKAVLMKALTVVQDKLKAAQAALDSVQTDYASKLADLDEQVRLKQSALDGVTREIAGLRARIAV